MDHELLTRELLAAVVGAIIAAVAALVATKLQAWYARKDVERFTVASLRAELAAGAVAVRDSERRWSDTVAGIGELLTNATKG